MTDKKRGRPKGSKGKPKTTTLSEVSKAMEEGIRFVEPISQADAVALYNAEHPEQFTEVTQIDKEKLNKIGAEYAKLAVKYNPFSNPLFNKKMGIDKNK